MHVEFKLLLVRLLKHLGYEGLLTEEQIEVCECPPVVGKRLMSNLAFLLAPKLGINKPLTLAKEIVQAAETSKLNLHFDLDTGGRGFVNATPRGGFYNLFLNAISACPESLFSRQSVFASYSKANLMTIYVPVEVLRRRVQGTELEQLFINGIAEGVRADMLMTLYALADSEVDVNVYLSGLSGRQNLEWYVERFKIDSSEILIHNNCLIDIEKLPIGCFPIIERFLSLRQHVIAAVRRGKPEVLVNELILLIQSFYEQFHHPRFRAKAVPFNNGALEGPLLQLIRSVVLLGFDRIEFGHGPRIQ